MADPAPEDGATAATTDDSHLNIIVDFIPEEYGDDTELNQDNNLVQSLDASEKSHSGEPLNALGKSYIKASSTHNPNISSGIGIQKTPEAVTGTQIPQQANAEPSTEFNPCAYEDPDSMISLPFLAGGEKYLPDIFKAFATAGCNLLQSFQQYMYEDECAAYNDSHDYNKNKPDNRGSRDAGRGGSTTMEQQPRSEPPMQRTSMQRDEEFLRPKPEKPLQRIPEEPAEVYQMSQPKPAPGPQGGNMGEMVVEQVERIQRISESRHYERTETTGIPKMLEAKQNSRGAVQIQQQQAAVEPGASQKLNGMQGGMVEETRIRISEPSNPQYGNMGEREVEQTEVIQRQSESTHYEKTETTVLPQMIAPKQSSRGVVQLQEQQQAAARRNSQKSSGRQEGIADETITSQRSAPDAAPKPQDGGKVREMELEKTEPLQRKSESRQEKPQTNPEILETKQSRREAVEMQQQQVAARRNSKSNGRQEGMVEETTTSRISEPEPQPQGGNMGEMEVEQTEVIQRKSESTHYEKTEKTSKPQMLGTEQSSRGAVKQPQAATSRRNSQNKQMERGEQERTFPENEKEKIEERAKSKERVEKNEEMLRPKISEKPLRMIEEEPAEMFQNSSNKKMGGMVQETTTVRVSEPEPAPGPQDGNGATEEMEEEQVEIVQRISESRHYERIETTVIPKMVEAKQSSRGAVQIQQQQAPTARRSSQNRQMENEERDIEERRREKEEMERERLQKEDEEEKEKRRREKEEMERERLQKEDEEEMERRRKEKEEMERERRRREKEEGEAEEARKENEEIDMRKLQEEERERRRNDKEEGEPRNEEEEMQGVQKEKEEERERRRREKEKMEKEKRRKEKEESEAENRQKEKEEMERRQKEKEVRHKEKRVSNEVQREDEEMERERRRKDKEERHKEKASNDVQREEEIERERRRKEKEDRHKEKVVSKEVEIYKGEENKEEMERERRRKEKEERHKEKRVSKEVEIYKGEETTRKMEVIVDDRAQKQRRSSKERRHSHDAKKLFIFVENEEPKKDADMQIKKEEEERARRNSHNNRVMEREEREKEIRRKEKEEREIEEHRKEKEEIEKERLRKEKEEMEREERRKAKEREERHRRKKEKEEKEAEERRKQKEEMEREERRKEKEEIEREVRRKEKEREERHKERDRLMKEKEEKEAEERRKLEMEEQEKREALEKVIKRHHRKKGEEKQPMKDKEMTANTRRRTSDEARIEREKRKSLDFVDYFFKKDGFTYIGILTQMKLDYEQRAMNALSKSSESIQKNAKRFKGKVDNLKKIIPVEKEKEIEEYNYPVVFEKDCKKFEIDIEDKIGHITKFHKYALKLVLHWKYLIREKLELEPLTVYEAATELLAGTMVLVYPVFVRLASFISQLCDNPRQYMDSYTSKYLMDHLRKMVDTISDEVGAIEESCAMVMNLLDSKNPHELQSLLGKLKAQGVHAKNSLSWAIKALGTILFHYNLLTILVQNGQYTSAVTKEKGPKEEKRKSFKIEEPQLGQKPAVAGHRPAEAGHRPAEAGHPPAEQMPMKSEKQKDFVDVFFQREGFQFIGVLSKLKMSYEDKCKMELQRASPKVRQMAEVIADKIHQIRKLSNPKQEKVIAEFDFPSVFVKEIAEFEIDITDKLNTIKQFHKYTLKLIDHWTTDLNAKVKIDPQSTYEVAIQLMAGLMSMIYPILIKMASFLSKLAETPKASRTHHPPERVARKVRKMIEAVTDELGAVGDACVKTIDKIGVPPEEAKDLKLKIYTQLKHAKNSVSWGVKAISPSIFYYFLRVLNEQDSGK